MGSKEGNMMPTEVRYAWVVEALERARAEQAMERALAIVEAFLELSGDRAWVRQGKTGEVMGVMELVGCVESEPPVVLVSPHELPLAWSPVHARLWGVDCVEHVLGIFEGVYPAERRVRAALEAARDFAGGERDEVALKATHEGVIAVCEQIREGLEKRLGRRLTAGERRRVSEELAVECLEARVGLELAAWCVARAASRAASLPVMRSDRVVQAALGARAARRAEALVRRVEVRASVVSLPVESASPVVERLQALSHQAGLYLSLARRAAPQLEADASWTPKDVVRWVREARALLPGLERERERLNARVLAYARAENTRDRPHARAWARADARAAARDLRPGLDALKVLVDSIEQRWQARRLLSVLLGRYGTPMG